MQNKERNSQKYGCGVKSQTELVCPYALLNHKPNQSTTLTSEKKTKIRTNGNEIILDAVLHRQVDDPRDPKDDQLSR